MAKPAKTSLSVPQRRSSKQIDEPIVPEDDNDGLSPSHVRKEEGSIVWGLAILVPFAAMIAYIALIHQQTKTSSPTLDHLQGILLIPGLIPTLALTSIAPLLTYHVVKATKDAFLKKGFGGKDLLKGNSNKIPESLGLPTSIVYCLLMCSYIPFRYGMGKSDSPQRTARSLIDNADGGWSGDMHGQRDFPHHELSSYLSSLMSILSSVLLGFIDDVFDIRWRLKMPIPLLASLPMLVVYQAGHGGTSVVVPGWPTFLRTWLGARVITLGPLYHLFILLVSTFSVHSINILAGINGVEVGQALIIGISLCCNDVLYLDPRAGQPGSFASVELRDRHLFSLALLLPFCGCCVGLLTWNKFPARVFVGDTFCYFAGQVLACAGVLGHFSKTLLLFFVPQLINFALSLPQLFGLVPCPRHRVPNVDLETMSLHPSIALFTEERPAGTLAQIILQIFSALHLIKLEWREENKRKVLHSTTNLTILNAILVFRGALPLQRDASGRVENGHEKQATHKVQISERGLWWHVMLFQAFCSSVAFAVRYWIAAIVFPQ
ncbi:uncharacterized protein FA14DRAFT_161445 [Meira miltonrushii]|uniref:UDP-N-acetylglucosamine--dolichyl-phosphate N-acetylglucosaminephosphotransferase n=1 Tax=Meira miltonrushii TaxID=1280837 RepID=A0A316V934_9BASI|nr:uncharacterized protein FA14DRAFT_161445 [Meira miltonrushii]PWN33754.1 hypothetical protein FA14DRAFT_161445 [Meira miltonrushii]